MTERTFKKHLNSLKETITEEEFNSFVDKNKDAILALKVTVDMANKGKNIDDWECWLANMLFE